MHQHSRILVPRCQTTTSIEDQLAEFKQQVVEERESRAAAEKAAADRAEAQQKRHEETLKKQHVETMQMFARLMEKQSGQEEQKQRDEQVHEAPVASDEVENPASPTSQDLHRAAVVLYPLRLAPERTNLARADKIETMVSTVSPLIHAEVEDPPYPR